MKKKIIWTTMIVAMVGTIFAYKYVNRPLADVQDLQADFCIAPETLLEAYEADEVNADAMYLGKILEIEGVVTDVDMEKLLVGLDTGSPISVISCEFSPSAKESIKDIVIGQKVAIKGECTGYLMDVVLKRCVIKQ